MSVKQMSLPTSTLQELLNYLTGRPYAEVFTLIEKLRNEAKAVPESEAVIPEVVEEV